MGRWVFGRATVVAAWYRSVQVNETRLQFYISLPINVFSETCESMYSGALIDVLDIKPVLTLRS